MKRFFWMLLLPAFMGCGEKNEDIVIQLHSHEGSGVFSSSLQIVWPGRIPVYYTGVPETIEEYVVRSISMQPEQNIWEFYRKNILSKEQFLASQERMGIDTTKLTDQEFDHRILILTGTHKNGKRVVITDTDNDKDFSNEIIFEYDYPLPPEEQRHIDKTIPLIKASVQLFVDGQIIDHEVELHISPYENYRTLTYHNVENEIERNYHLFVSMPYHKRGEVILQDQVYNVFATTNGVNHVFHKGNTRIFISPADSEPSERDGDISASVGEVINLEGHDYRIESISSLGESLTLSYMGENPDPFGITEGYNVPRFNAVTIENDEFNLALFPGKHVLIDFWGTWCGPCVRLIPDFRKLNADYKDRNFQLVSVAFDSDFDKVKNFTVENQMDWMHIFVDQNRREENSLVELFRVTSFPTKILIDPSGKILARGRSIDEIRNMLDENL
jgi:thiol-disulfide isomerase/thioredoxin